MLPALAMPNHGPSFAVFVVLDEIRPVRVRASPLPNFAFIADFPPAIEDDNGILGRRAALISVQRKREEKRYRGLGQVN
jgi:hypothetical protein